MWIQPFTLGNLTSGRANNFNLLRFIAASLVIVSHSYALAGHGGAEPVMRYFGFLETGGTLGVLIFFAISGFLIVKSFTSRDGRLKTFLAARALRIYPGLISATLFSAVLASFATSVPIHSFVTDHMTRRFLWHNIRGYPTEYFLPGAFAHNPVGGVVNGSLWTLPVEIQMYLVIAALGVLGILGAREWFNTFFAAFLLVVGTAKLADLPLIYGENAEVARMAIIFLLGSCLYINRHHVAISIPWMVLLAAAIAVFHKAPNVRMIYLPAVAYIVIVLAYHPKLYWAGFNRLGDYSYGLYVYAYPTQQLIGYHYRGIGPLTLFLIAYPCILLTAILSWYLLEKPALKLKSRFVVVRHGLSPPPLVHFTQSSTRATSVPATH